MADNPVQLPPQALEAEMAVLGSMLIERDAVEKALDILIDKDFYQETHRIVFRAAAAVAGRGSAVDLITITEELNRQKQMEAIGGASVLSDLINRVATAAHVEYYARIVKEKAILRELISAATNIVAACYHEAKEPARILDEAQANILKVAERQSVQNVFASDQLAQEALERLEALHKLKRPITGVASGLKELDRLTTGFQKSDLILLAARPSQGKTALALNVASHVVLQERKPVLFFSLEMSRHAIMDRLISVAARVDLAKIRTGNFDRKYWAQLSTAAADLSDAPLYVNDMPGISVMGVRSIARQLSAELRRKGTELGMVVIDYLQLMRGSGHTESRQQEVSEISRGLKHLARDLNVPLIALSQLSRRTEDKGRSDARPQLSDLRESGALEQDADLVMFIYRESYYKPNDPTLEGKAEIIVAKQRQGPTGPVEVAFERQFTRFTNLLTDGGGAMDPGPEPVEEATQTSFSE